MGTPKYVNEISFDSGEPIGTANKIPFSVTMSKLNAADTNSVVSVKRFTYGVDDSSTTLSGVDSMSTNIVTIANIWNASADPSAPGKYRIQILAQKTGGAAIDEANVVVIVI